MTAVAHDDVAEHLSRVTGRAITYVPETVEQAYASRAHFGAPAFEVDGWVTSYPAIATGTMATVSPTVRIMTGREPESFATWLDLNPQEWAHLRD